MISTAGAAEAARTPACQAVQARYSFPSTQLPQVSFYACPKPLSRIQRSAAQAAHKPSDKCHMKSRSRHEAQVPQAYITVIHRQTEHRHSPSLQLLSTSVEAFGHHVSCIPCLPCGTHILETSCISTAHDMGLATSLPHTTMQIYCLQTRQHLLSSNHVFKN